MDSKKDVFIDSPDVIRRRFLMVYCMRLRGEFNEGGARRGESSSFLSGLQNFVGKSMAADDDLRF